MLRDDETAAVKVHQRKLEQMAHVARRSQWFFVGLFLFWELANFTGLSFLHLRRLSDAELADAAIRYNYPEIYSNVSDLKNDYSVFNPEVYYWTDLTGEAGNLFLNKLFGWKYFQVRLPDAVIMVSADGQPQFSRPCRDGSWCSPSIQPDTPKLGIVGTVQDGPPNYEAKRDYTVRWVNGSQGSVFISGHCFAAYSESPKATLQIVGAKPEDVVTISDMYGYRLISIPDIKRSGYGSIKISQKDFSESQRCDPSVRAKWPNVGGASWKR
ncbi:hypothetical protein ONR75_03205 [Rhodopseudomonas sp. P2A-2r]|uniref:hypothetical protein n=1 Tax=Rhodopseudomonas sp. P2A-2r TaxID=2991972 RepID=UPI002234D678|nr:hypothetical protein [Rhodopseudomonas sp. P2A-2r]UZE49820.1 hypothetical protein ONR75_03205 [Rhodopseudomonas sp. P2A-2r]